MTSGNGRGDAEALRAEIARTRAELGETVQALAAKADVKARVKESAAQTRLRVRQQAAHTTAQLRGQARVQARRAPLPLAAVAAGAVAVVVAVLVLRGRRR
jgi:hypothetical protein